MRAVSVKYPKHARYNWRTLEVTRQPVTVFLYATQTVGAVFVGLFLAAYLAGLPTTAVLHSDPTIRLALTVLGVAYLVLTLAAVVLAFLKRKTAAPT
jgi:threonine/homoserine/homoserine lactone efflux protein